MAITRTQVVLHTTDGLVENFITNTWHTIDGNAQAKIDFHNALYAFYNLLSPWFSGTLAQNGHEVKSYSLFDPKPRAPVLETTFNFPAAPPTTSLPTEVALCLSFQGLKTSGIQQARRRGRVYLGPWGANACMPNGRPNPSLTGTINEAADGLLDASNASATFVWGVFSPTIGGEVPTDESSFTIINDGWVDNAFDTQRRRGVAPTSRLLFPIP